MTDANASRRRGWRALLGAATLALGGCVSVPDGLQVVQDFDAARYLGRWYEIARLDHRFERGLSEVTAEYRARDDGGIDVINGGYDAAAGRWRQARGRAYFVGARDRGQLRVSFFRPFYSGYNVLMLDPDYRWALVAGNDRRYLWILAREAALPEDVMRRLIDQAAAWGFDTDALLRVEHGRAAR